RSRLHRIVPILAVITAALAGPAAAQTAAPGGFLEQATTAQVRARATPTLPARGKFTFPAPYNTVGVRITNGSDCGGADCVDYVGSSYWRHMNNHAGTTTLPICVSLYRNRGARRPTLVGA